VSPTIAASASGFSSLESSWSRRVGVSMIRGRAREIKNALADTQPGEGVSLFVTTSSGGLLDREKTTAGHGAVLPS